MLEGEGGGGMPVDCARALEDHAEPWRPLERAGSGAILGWSHPIYGGRPRRSQASPRAGCLAIWLGATGASPGPTWKGAWICQRMYCQRTGYFLCQVIPCYCAIPSRVLLPGTDHQDPAKYFAQCLLFPVSSISYRGDLVRFAYY